MRLEIKRKFTARTDRVKCVDCHPTEPWLLSSLYNGSVWLWNYDTQTVIKSFECSELPIRTVRFIPRKSWIIMGGDDLFIKVYNYHTFEKVTQFEAHADYIRCIDVHNTSPYVLSCADDLLIKLWDWEKGWRNIMTFDGHSHFVMHVVFNPKDSNTFASASLDKTIKVWNIGSQKANFSLLGHEKGVNSVDYYHGKDRPYLISGADDLSVRVWDYQNKSCTAVLEGHTANVSSVAFHPELPIIITGSEDGTIKVWNSSTNKLEQSLNYGLERVWSIAYQLGSNDIALGFDEGSLVIKLGREEPAVSLDSSGKLVWAKHNLILSANLQGSIGTVKDSEKLALTVKEMGTCEIFPQTLTHSPCGRYVVVTGDGEYIVYTALAWRNRSFGNGLEFTWSPSNEYVIREGSSRLRLYDRQFKERNLQINLNYTTERLFQGPLLGVKSGVGFLTFYDWEAGNVVRRIEVVAHAVFWNGVGDLVAIACKESIFILRYKADEWNQHCNTVGPAGLGDEGLESAFEFLHEIPEHAKSGCWVSDCFIFISGNNRLCYLIGGQTFTLFHSDSTSIAYYLLGYVQSEQRIYYCDKDVNIYSWKLPVNVINYQTAIIRGDLELATSLLPEIAQAERNKLAQFLDQQKQYELALDITDDDMHRFDLALRTSRLEVALKLAEKLNLPSKWKAVAETALKMWNFNVAESCLKKAGDIDGLFLLYTARGDTEGLRRVAEWASAEACDNLAFASYLCLRDFGNCVDLLSSRGRQPEAALLARAFSPTHLPGAVKVWRKSLPDKLAGRIADINITENEKDAECVQTASALKATEYMPPSPITTTSNLENELES